MAVIITGSNTPTAMGQPTQTRLLVLETKATGKTLTG
jgi:hypothetical protein